ncbi:MAG: protein-L-isoaspartate O-methyltransferase, partial [Alphaproteobacteria bacterium]|nr:protein-L-isoaspartate O-methyltransferase [Alphaproteobacteria bacterium]
IGHNVETVIALEDNNEAVEAMSERFAAIGMDHAVAVEGDLAKGLADQGPFEVIFVAGMVETVPQAWLDQLSDGGRLGVVVSVGRGLGEARIYTRTGEIVSHRDVFECCPPVLPGFEKAAAFEF